MFDWHAQKVVETHYHNERIYRENELRKLEITNRTRKVEIMKEAGFSCSEDDPDYYMFHNPFVWMQSRFHKPWAGIDYDIAKRIFDIDAQTQVVRDTLNEWRKENDPWSLSSTASETALS